jgi:hypothetical protein
MAFYELAIKPEKTKRASAVHLKINGLNLHLEDRGTPTGYLSSSFIPGPVQPIPGNTLLPRFRIACAPSQSISAAGGDRNPIRRASTSRILLLMRRKLSKRLNLIDMCLSAIPWAGK